MAKVSQRAAKSNDRDNPRGFNKSTLRIIDFLGGDRHSGKCFCPRHDDGQRPSLQVRNGDRWPTVVHCFGKGTKEHDREVVEYLRAKGVWSGLSPQQLAAGEKKAKTPEERRNYALKVWRGVKRNEGEKFAHLLKHYLRPRGIKEVPTTALCSLPYAYGQGSGVIISDYPAMVLPMRNSQGKFQGLQATWLNRDMTAKREPEPQRQTYGLLKGNHVQLCELDYDRPTPLLLIGEGSETALSAMQLTEKPGIAAGGKGNLKDLIPPAADEYIILVDADKDGGSRKDAGILAQRLVDNGAIVRIAMPTRPDDGKDGFDWNDAVITLRAGREAARQLEGSDPENLPTEAALGELILNSPLFNRVPDRGRGISAGNPRADGAGIARP